MDEKSTSEFTGEIKGSEAAKIFATGQPQQTEHQNFIQAFYALNLPQKLMESNKNKSFRIQSSNTRQSGVGGKQGGSKKKEELTTTFDQNNKFHMVEKIDLSNYRGKNFSRAAFREFLESIADMRCLKSIVLSNNGIDETFLEEISKRCSLEMAYCQRFSFRTSGSPQSISLAMTSARWEEC